MGNISDTIKKRRIFVLIGFGGLALALLMMGLATTMNGYLFANFMLGLLSTAAAPVGTVLILESFKNTEWAQRLGDFSRVGGIGWVCGLILGMIWLAFLSDGRGEFTMRALFLVGAALSTLSMVLAYKWVPEPEEKIDRRDINSSLLQIPLMIAERARYLPQRIIYVLRVSSKNFKLENFPSNLRLFYTFTLVTFVGYQSFFIAFPIFLNSYVGPSSSEVFLIYVAFSLASALTYSQAGRRATDLGSRRVLAGSITGRIFLFPAMFAVTLFSLGRVEMLIVFCILHALMGFSWANISVSGSHILAETCYSEYRAESTGLYNSMQGVATIVGAMVGGFVGQFMGYQALFTISSIFLVLGLILLSKVDIEGDPPRYGPIQRSIQRNLLTRLRP